MVAEAKRAQASGNAKGGCIATLSEPTHRHEDAGHLPGVTTEEGRYARFAIAVNRILYNSRNRKAKDLGVNLKTDTFK